MEVLASFMGGGLVGALVVYFVLRAMLAKAQIEAARLSERYGALIGETERERARFERDTRIAAEERQRLRDDVQRLTLERTALHTQLTNERTSAGEKLASLQQAREQMTNEFKVLAARIFDENKKHFTEQSRSTLGELLDPLKIQIGEFKQKVEHVYEVEGKERRTISDELKSLREMNFTLSNEANNLTRALKGSSKAQGVWGELVLESVLEDSGLRKGIEYETQLSHTREDGSRARPDVIIRLPEGRQLVIDAKVSLVAYEEHASAESEPLRDGALKRHIESVRAHLKGLSAKEYQKLHEVEAVDFVLMFVAIEPAFMLAVTQDRHIFKEAWDRNVLLVSPSTLMFVLRTVAHLWRQEQQTRNTQEIAQRGAELYDKLCAFVGDLENVGKRLAQAQDAFDDARAKLSTGRGNALDKARQLRELGIKPTKQLPLFLGQPADEPANDSVEPAAPETAI